MTSRFAKILSILLAILVIFTSTAFAGRYTPDNNLLLLPFDSNSTYEHGLDGGNGYWYFEDLNVAIQDANIETVQFMMQLKQLRILKLSRWIRFIC